MASREECYREGLAVHKLRKGRHHEVTGRMLRRILAEREKKYEGSLSRKDLRAKERLAAIYKRVDEGLPLRQIDEYDLLCGDIQNGPTE